MTGVDLFRAYQTVTSWPAVKAAGVEFVWVKATNGTNIATFPDRTSARADPVVSGATSMGIPVGLYHYALAGDPIAQADVFADEVIRLGCHGPGYLPPALDLEEPSITNPRSFAIAFLTHLRQRIGQNRVAFYSAASWMATLLPETWGLPGLVIWTAAYGVNDGNRHPITGYTGRTDVHQYTSAGSCPGITSKGLDMNVALIPLDQLLGRSTPGDDDMAAFWFIGNQVTGEVAMLYPNGDLVGVGGSNWSAVVSANQVPKLDVPQAVWDDMAGRYVGNLAHLAEQLAAKLPAGGTSGPVTVNLTLGDLEFTATTTGKFTKAATP